MESGRGIVSYPAMCSAPMVGLPLMVDPTTTHRDLQILVVTPIYVRGVNEGHAQPVTRRYVPSKNERRLLRLCFDLPGRGCHRGFGNAMLRLIGRRLCAGVPDRTGRHRLQRVPRTTTLSRTMWPWQACAGPKSPTSWCAASNCAVVPISYIVVSFVARENRPNDQRRRPGSFSSCGVRRWT
jgi:hypothetical protein